MSDAQAGPGWLLKHNGTLVAEVRDINGPEQTAEKDDVTNQSSVGFYREWVTTLLDGGDVTFECNYLPGNASQIALLTALQARGVEAFTIDQPAGGTVLAFDARLTKWAPKMPKDKAATLDVTLAVTGPVTAS